MNSPSNSFFWCGQVRFHLAQWIEENYIPGVKLNPEDVGSQAGGCQACCVFTVVIGQSFHNLSTVCKFLSFVDFDRYNFPEMGQANFFFIKSANLQILGPSPPSQTHKFLMFASPRIITRESQFRKFVHNTAQLCLKTVLNTTLFVGE